MEVTLEDMQTVLERYTISPAQLGQKAIIVVPGALMPTLRPDVLALESFLRDAQCAHCALEIVFTGAANRSDSPREMENLRSLASQFREEGYHVAVLENDRDVVGTQGNAKALRNYLFQQPSQHVIVVGPSYFLPRRLCTFSKWLPEGVTLSAIQSKGFVGHAMHALDGQFGGYPFATDQEIQETIWFPLHVAVELGDFQKAKRLALEVQHTLFEREVKKIHEYAAKGDCISLDEL